MYLERVPLFSSETRPKLVQQFNATERRAPTDELINEQFEAQVRRTPEAVAVVFEGESLTYAQLNARANQLARYLREKSVGVHDLVALCVERSLEMVVGLLGILESRGGLRAARSASSLAAIGVPARRCGRACLGYAEIGRTCPVPAPCAAARNRAAMPSTKR